jgi:type II secretion system protein H
MTSATGQQANRHAWRRGFTLVELVLVLALLVIAISLVAPGLSGFLRGRALDAEARRLLALTRAARERAVSTGVPVALWLNVEQQTYGMEPEAAQASSPPAEEQEFSVDEKVQLDEAPLAAPGTAVRNLPAIRFLPDGTIDEDSPKAVQLSDSAGVAIQLVQSRNRNGYEITAANP